MAHIRRSWMDQRYLFEIQELMKRQGKILQAPYPRSTIHGTLMDSILPEHTEQTVQAMR